MALVENIQREDLNPIDRAQGYRTLMDQLGLTQAELQGGSGRNAAPSPTSSACWSWPSRSAPSCGTGSFARPCQAPGGGGGHPRAATAGGAGGQPRAVGPQPGAAAPIPRHPANPQGGGRIVARVSAGSGEEHQPPAGLAHDGLPSASTTSRGASRTSSAMARRWASRSAMSSSRRRWAPAAR